MFPLGRSARGLSRPRAQCFSLTAGSRYGPRRSLPKTFARTCIQEIELSSRHCADPCLLLVHRELQLAHDLAQALQGRFGLALSAQLHVHAGVRKCPLHVCAVTRRCFPVGASPTRRTLQPEATGAVMEVTKWLKASPRRGVVRDPAGRPFRPGRCRPRPPRGEAGWPGMVHRNLAGRDNPRRSIPHSRSSAGRDQQAALAREHNWRL